MDQELLYETLGMINASLNKRFEKDADLYISKQDEYELKKHLCNEEYGAVTDMMRGKGINPEIVLKVIIRNAAILHIRNIKSFEKGLAELFETVDYKTAGVLMEDVMDSNIYMQKELKNLIFKYYCQKAPVTKINAIWKERADSLNKDCRKEIVYNLMIRAKMKDSSKTFGFRWDLVKTAIDRYPEFCRDEDMLVVLKDGLSETDQKKLFTKLTSEMSAPNLMDDAYKRMIENVLITYNVEAFEFLIKGLSGYIVPVNFKSYINTAIRMMNTDDNSIAVYRYSQLAKIALDPSANRKISNRIGNKLWKNAKKIECVYSKYKNTIDSELLKRDAEDASGNKKYNSFGDIIKEMENGVSGSSIAYIFIKVPRKLFIEILKDSFKKTPSGFRFTMFEVYSSLFSHSQNMGGLDRLQDMCGLVAKACIEYYNECQGWTTPEFDEMDRILLHTIDGRKLTKGRNIKEYIFSLHYSPYAKELYGEV